MEFEALATALEFGSPDTVERARSCLIEALDRFVDIPGDGRIRIRGKFGSHASFGEDRLRDQEIPAEVFHDFARFDILNDGLNSGRGLAWRYSSEGMDTASRDRPDAAYRSVKINRDDIVVHAKKRERASPYKRGRPPDRQAILDKADEMKSRGLSGYQIPQ